MYSLMNKKRDGQYKSKFYQFADKNSKIFKYHDNDVMEFTYCYNDIEEFCRFLNEEHHGNDMEVIFKIENDRIKDIEFVDYYENYTEKNVVNDYPDWYIYHNGLQKLTDVYDKDFFEMMAE